MKALKGRTYCVGVWGGCVWGCVGEWVCGGVCVCSNCIIMSSCDSPYTSNAIASDTATTHVTSSCYAK